MADKLDEYCWLSIVQHLNLKDQMSLALVSEKMRNIIRRHWLLLKRVELLGDSFTLLDKYRSIEKDLLESISPQVQEVLLHNCRNEHVLPWLGHDFSQVRSLDCHMNYDTSYNIQENQIGDIEVFLMTQIFPNLTSLKLTSNTSGELIWNWGNLEELYLMWCEHLEMDSFELLFTNLKKLRKFALLNNGFGTKIDKGIRHITKCKSLEEFAVDNYCLQGAVLLELFQLPFFRKICLYRVKNFAILMSDLALWKPRAVRSFWFNYMNMLGATSYIYPLRFLRQLSFRRVDLRRITWVDLCSKLKFLEELHLTNMDYLPEPSELGEVAGSKTLKLLNISDRKLDVDYHNKIALSIDKALEERSTPLVLNAFSYGNGLKHFEIDTKGSIRAFNEHNKLRLSFKPNTFAEKNYHWNWDMPDGMEIGIKPDGLP